MSIFILLTQ